MQGLALVAEQAGRELGVVPGVGQPGVGEVDGDDEHREAPRGGRLVHPPGLVDAGRLVPQGFPLAGALPVQLRRGRPLGAHRHGPDQEDGGEQQEGQAHGSHGSLSLGGWGGPEETDPAGRSSRPDRFPVINIRFRGAGLNG